jgi:hypothetical protein
MNLLYPAVADAAEDFRSSRAFPSRVLPFSSGRVSGINTKDVR